MRKNTNRVWIVKLLDGSCVEKFTDRLPSASSEYSHLLQEIVSIRLERSSQVMLLAGNGPFDRSCRWPTIANLDSNLGF